MAIIKYSAEEFSKVIDLVSTAQKASEQVSTSINDFVNLANEISSKWIDHNCNIEPTSVLDRIVYLDADGKEYASSEGGKRSEKRYYKDVYKPVNVLDGYSTQYDNKASAVAAQKAYNQSKINEYNGIASNAKTYLDDVLADNINQSLQITNEILTKIKDSITNFEDTYKELSLKEMWDKLDKRDLESISVEEVTLENGEKVDRIYFTYKDENGNDIKLTLPEAVNSFVSYLGAATSNIVATNMLLEEMGLDPKNEEDLKFINEYMTKAMLDTNAYIDDISEKGLYLIASGLAIDEFYEAVSAGNSDLNGKTINEAYESVISKIENDSELAGGILGSETNAAMVGGFAMFAGVMSSVMNIDEDEIKNRKLSEEDSERVEKAKDELEKKKEEENKPASEGEVKPDVERTDGDVQPVQPEPELPPEEPEPALPPEEPEPDLPPDEPEPELPPEEPVPTPEVSEEAAQGVRESITANENLNPPEEVEGIELTSEDIDNQVRDEYYSDPNLAENRVKAVDTYDTMTDSERVESLEALGYTTVVAAGLVADKAAGQAAYVIGIDEQNMANMSNALAAQNGITNHNTRFDDGHNLSYFESGQAGVDMAPANAEVQAARANLTTARGNYNSAVTTANSAINEANESKERYNSTLSNIKKKKGDNPQDWSQEDVDEYNKAAREYNEAVDKANKAVADAEAQRAAYERERAAYDKAYEECRKQAEAGVQTVINNDQSEEIVESVPAVPDVVENVNEEGVFSTEAIPMTSPGSEEVTEPVTNTPVNTEEPTPTLNDTFYEE